MSHPRTTGVLAGLILALCAATPTLADTLTVTNALDSGPGSLRQAIADAADGDTIDFAGTIGNIVLASELTIDKSVTIAAVEDGDVVLSGNQQVRVLRVAPGKSVSLSMIRLVSGVAANGGAVYNQGNLQLRGCSLFSNTATGEFTGGAAVHNAAGASLTLEDSVLSDNTATGDFGFGGAIYSEGRLTARRCWFSFNQSTGYRGGAIVLDGAVTDPLSVVEDTRFDNNTAFSDGGAVCVLSAPLQISRCRFESNQAGGDSYSSGGGIYNIYGDVRIDNSLFENNRAQGASGGGGALYAYGAASLVNCTLFNNFAAGQGGGVCAYYDTVSVTNSILWSNSAPSGRQATVFDTGTPPLQGAIRLSHNDLAGGLAGGAGLVDLGDNFDSDPAFVSLSSYPSDLRLTSASPCVNTGDSAAAGTLDLDGAARVREGVVDLGAYESPYGGTPDTTPPTVTWGAVSPAPNAAGWNRTAIEIPFTVTDDASGVAYVSTSSPVTINNSGAGLTVAVVVRDNAGNERTVFSPAVNIDPFAPVTTASVSGGTVTLNASDSISGVKSTTYQIDGGPQQTYTGPFTVPAGQHTVTYRSVDVADNVETLKQVDVDNRVALNVTVTNLAGRRGAKSKLTATVVRADNNAAVSGLVVTFRVDGAVVGTATTNRRGTASIPYTIPNLPSGNYPIVASTPADATYQAGSGQGTLTVR